MIKIKNLEGRIIYTFKGADLRYADFTAALDYAEAVAAIRKWGAL